MLYRIHNPLPTGNNNYGDFLGYIRLCSNDPHIGFSTDVIYRKLSAKVSVVGPCRITPGYPVGASMAYTYLVQCFSDNQYRNKYYLHPVEPLTRTFPQVASCGWNEQWGGGGYITTTSLNNLIYNQVVWTGNAGGNGR